MSSRIFMDENGTIYEIPSDPEHFDGTAAMYIPEDDVWAYTEWSQSFQDTCKELLCD